MHDWNWDAIFVRLMRIHANTIFRVGLDFPKCPKHQIARLHLAHALFIRGAISAETQGMMGKHVAGKVDLKSPTARIVLFSSEMIVARYVNVIRRPVLVKRGNAFKLLQINIDPSSQMAVKVAPNDTVGVGQPVRMLR